MSSTSRFVSIVSHIFIPLRLDHSCSKPSIYSKLATCLQPGPSEAATIAWRTRSKLPLENTPLEQIELGFVAPDISADMYDTYCDDTDWKNFLCSFVKNEGNVLFMFLFISMFFKVCFSRLESTVLSQCYI